MGQLLKLAVEAGPLVVFFVVNSRAGIMTATAAFMAATVVAVALSWSLDRRLPVMPMVSGVFVLGFGGLTLLLADETFIKLKPTIVNLLFAAILLSGQLLDLRLLPRLFGSFFHLTDEGWRRLAWRWCSFFVVLAALNEAVWRTQDTEVWIQFKLFAILPLTLVFSMAQLPLIERYKATGEGDAAGG